MTMNAAIELNPDSAGLGDVPGFKLAATGCDIRHTGDGRLDLALIVSETPATTAGVFTTNDIKAAPVLLCQKHLKSLSTHRAIVVNSGNANACTGPAGTEDAAAMAWIVADRLGVPTESVLVCSTGRIGRVLPIERILNGIEQLMPRLSRNPAQSQAAAEAILTSDTRTKTATATFICHEKTITVAGMAKGAGMIEPNMATMLAFIATDAEVPREALDRALSEAVQGTFNACTVDGDMSTNDTVLVMANGSSGIKAAPGQGQVWTLFKEALRQVCATLADKIVADGERVTKFVTIEVEGAPNEAAAARVARAVGNSLLVKSSWFGNDPNWGRLIDAAGYAKIGLREECLDLDYDDCPVLRQGRALDENLPRWREIVARPQFCIRFNLHLGDGRACLRAADLSPGYVDFNKSE